MAISLFSNILIYLKSEVDALLGGKSDVGHIHSSPGARVYNVAAISVGNAAVQILTFDTERFDTDNIHDLVANTGRLTCRTAGIYVITGCVEYASNTVGVREVCLRLNGTTFIAAMLYPAPGYNCQIEVTTVYQLAAGDYVELGAYQTSGGPLNILASRNYSPEFALVRVG